MKHRKAQVHYICKNKITNKFIKDIQKNEDEIVLSATNTEDDVRALQLAIKERKITTTKHLQIYDAIIIEDELIVKNRYRYRGHELANDIIALFDQMQWTHPKIILLTAHTRTIDEYIVAHKSCQIFDTNKSARSLTAKIVASKRKIVNKFACINNIKGGLNPIDSYGIVDKSLDVVLTADKVEMQSLENRSIVDDTYCMSHPYLVATIQDCVIPTLSISLSKRYGSTCFAIQIHDLLENNWYLETYTKADLSAWIPWIHKPLNDFYRDKERKSYTHNGHPCIKPMFLHAIKMFGGDLPKIMESAYIVELE